MFSFTKPEQLDNLNEYLQSPKVNVVQANIAWHDQKTDYLIKQRGKIVVLFLIEYNHVFFLEPLLNNARAIHQRTGRLQNYYIFVSLHHYPESLLNEFRDYCTMIYEPSLYCYYSTRLPLIEYTPTDKKLHFLSLNNRASVNRQSLYYFMEKFLLREKSYFSYRALIQWSNYKSVEEIANAINTGGDPWFMQGLDLIELHKKLPVTIPGDRFKDNDWGMGKDFYYKDTFCSIVTETFPAEEHPMLTEKAFKPIAFFQPFLLDGPNGSLSVLHNLGFKTFNNWWDESYDEQRDHHRLESIFRLILEISNWSHDRINLVYNEMLPILHYNHNHLFNVLPKMFNDKKQELFNQIKCIVADKEGLVG